MSDFLALGFDSNAFMPHGHCYLWTPWLLWTYVASDSLIGLAYYSIPIALTVFVRRRTDLQFSWVFVLFSVFICACGTTHFMSIWTIWNPDYALDAALKAVTAAASIVTAVLLWPLVPKAVALPSPNQLQQVLSAREREIAERIRAEQALAAANESLEHRVLERTAALQEAEHRLQNMLVTERSARIEAERLSRMKDEFLLTLSHELRTPLNAIFGWAQILKRSKADSATVEKGIDVIDRNVRAQTKLIEDLLDMSAIIAGKIRLDVQPVDLAAVIDMAVESVKPAIDAKQLKLEKVIDPLAGPVSGDASRLQQVLWNVLSNSAKFTPKGGKIRLTLERVNSHVEFSVADNGEGIDPEFLPLLFERFSQADSSSRRRHGGIGLGLSIVKSLVEAHGGQVRAKSPGLGQGSTFIVSLPLRASYAETERREHPRTSIASVAQLDFNPPTLAGLRVLVIDDEKDARELVKKILEDSGATVCLAASAAEGYDQTAKSLPNLIVCDIGMPVADGYDFIRQLRATGVQVPVLALTAFARTEDRIRSLQAGFAAHLAKPIEPAELLATIANLAASRFMA
jgi:signal transduction histidine kinase/CheY-like chemotaxis protein